MKKLAVFLMLCCLGACVGTTKPSRFYAFKSLTSGEAAPVSMRKLSIGVADVTVPSYLDRPQIITSSDDEVEYQASEFNRWSEPLSGLLQRTIANDMAVYMPNAVVKQKTDSREKFDYVVYVEVNQLEGSWKHQAVFDAWWYVVKSDGQTLVRKRSRFVTPLGEGYEELVLKESKLVAQLAEQIAGYWK